MLRPHRRTTLAAALITVAVLLPTSAWYVSGSAGARRKARTIEAEAALQIREQVELEAARLGTQLELLRRRESERPFFHYQTLYHDPRGAAEGLSVTPSPLASGTTDPLVWAHFQIDEDGEVSLPTVNDRFPELSSSSDFSRFCSLLTDLQHAVMVEAQVEHRTSGADEERVLTLSESEWEQILLAENVYASITGQSASVPVLPAGGDLGRVVIRVKPLQWHTLVLGSGPALAALREVRTPAGVLLQGFTIASGAVALSHDAGPIPLDFSPSATSSSATVAALVGDTGWILEANSGPATALATAAGQEVKFQFRRTFTLTATAVILITAAVILILFQTDRLARQRARFAAAAAHELKTPLSGLLLHSEMLEQDLGDPERRAHYASTVVAEADRLGRVVTNMLDLARLERGALLAHPRPGDLGAAVLRCVERARPRLEEAGLNLEVTIAPGLPMAHFDTDALCQILDNLLDNAEKHTRAEADRRIGVVLKIFGDMLRTEITDNGPGIPRNRRRKLFRPFDRSPEADGTPGLGLGLALARSLARAQDGDLNLDTSDHPGATFVLTLPRSPARDPLATANRE